MTTVLDVAPEVLVRSILRGVGVYSGWKPANTSGVTPRIHQGWLDRGYDEPEVTITNPEESPVQGGETGYRGIDPAGGSPHQRIDGTVTVVCWSSRERSNVNARQLTHEMKEEVRRLIQDDYDAPSSSVIDRLSYLNGQRRPEDTEEEETLYRYDVLVGYGYTSS